MINDILDLVEVTLEELGYGNKEVRIMQDIPAYIPALLIDGKTLLISQIMEVRHSPDKFVELIKTHVEGE